MPKPAAPLPDAADLRTLIQESARARGFSLDPDTGSRLASHLALTLKWGRVTNLTAILEPHEAVERHVLESIEAAAFVEEKSGALLDIGSGNGYPGLAIKCVKPALPTLLLEPALRKSVFLKHAITELRLTGIEVRRERVDDPADLMKYAPLGCITLRGVPLAATAATGAAEALAPGGRLILFLGGSKQSRLETRSADLRVVGERAFPGRHGSRLLVLERA